MDFVNNDPTDVEVVCSYPSDDDVSFYNSPGADEFTYSNIGKLTSVSMAMSTSFGVVVDLVSREVQRS